LNGKKKRATVPVIQAVKQPRHRVHPRKEETFGKIKQKQGAYRDALLPKSFTAYTN